jgi:2-oxoglutarate ferredoxin oxidoreductase subunit gamma
MKILFAGEGGQGVQVIAEILAKGSFLDKKHSTYIPNFGVEQRGGVSLAFVIVSDRKKIGYPKFDKADILAILSNRSLKRVKEFINKDTIVIYGPAVSLKKPKGAKKFYNLESGDFPNKVWNMLVLGKINTLKNIVSQNSLKQAVNDRFEKYFKDSPSLKELDYKALGI